MWKVNFPLRGRTYELCPGTGSRLPAGSN
jgi:hypothetical protein